MAAFRIVEAHGLERGIKLEQEAGIVTSVVDTEIMSFHLPQNQTRPIAYI